MIVVFLSVFAASLVLSLVSTALVRYWSLRVGFVDRPGGRKQHDTPIALGGGIALALSMYGPIIVGGFVVWLLHDPSNAAANTLLPAVILRHAGGISAKLPTVLAIGACVGALLITGLIDDRKPMGAPMKLTIQVAVALVTAGLIGVRIAEALPVAISVGATVIWIVFMTNAFNFLDNMDGLSAGVAAIASVIFAIAAARAGQVFVPVMALVMAGGLCGFLWFNFSPAKIFMGDAGSLVIGYLLGVVTILTTYYDPSQGLRPLGIVVPIVVLAVPIYDVISVVTHRIRLGESPFKADRRHFSHRLVQRGMSPRGAVLTIYLATAATGLPAIALPHSDWLGAALILFVCVCVVVMIAILEHNTGGKTTDPPPP